MRAQLLSVLAHSCSQCALSSNTLTLARERSLRVQLRSSLSFQPSSLFLAHIHHGSPNNHPSSIRQPYIPFDLFFSRLADPNDCVRVCNRVFFSSFLPHSVPPLFAAKIEEQHARPNKAQKTRSVSLFFAHFSSHNHRASLWEHESTIFILHFHSDCAFYRHSIGSVAAAATEPRAFAQKALPHNTGMCECVCV